MNNPSQLQSVDSKNTEPINDPSTERTESTEEHIEEQNVTYITGQPSVRTALKNNLSYFGRGITDTLPLNKTLERPIKITEFQFEVNKVENELFDPWTLWQSDSFVKSKLANYSYFKCNLHIRIVPAATKFLYGQYMIRYIPFGTKNEIWDNMYNKVRAAAVYNTEEMYLQYISTYPIGGQLNVSDQNVVEMELPFIWHKNYVSINGTTTEAKESLGQINIVSQNTLSAANTGTSTFMNVAVFAWATDFELFMPTNLEPTATKRKSRRFKIKSSGETDEIDEGTGGVLSTTASAVANVSSRLEDVPVIGTFAKATTLGATAVSSIARLFGFSNPPTIESATPRVLRLYRNLATIDQPDTAMKLSMDSKQELTIDSGVIGAGTVDDMTVAVICAKEQWIGKASWQGATGQLDVPELICAATVNPMSCRQTVPFLVDVHSAQANMMSPAGHLGNIFNNWRGTIVYRFEAVCSDYHAGTLQIQFEPFVTNKVLAKSDVYTEDTNKRITLIWNITQKREITLEIPFISNQMFLKTRRPNQQNFNPSGYDDSVVDIHTEFNPDYDLGIVSVSVVNELTAPKAPAGKPGMEAGIDINVYMHCKDMQFAMPRDGWSNEVFVPTAGLLESHKNILIPTEEDDDALINFGERFTSIRSILKRPMVTYADVINGGDNPFAYIFELYFPHFAPETLRTKSRKLCYESYFAPAYLAKRGSMRWKVFLYNNNVNAGTETYPSNVGFNSITRDASDTEFSGAANPVLLDKIPNGALSAYVRDGASGSQFTATDYSPAVDVDCPFYSNTRFNLACSITNVAADDTFKKNPTMNEILYQRGVAHLAGQNTRYIAHTSTGEDYNLMVYQAPPPVFQFS